MLNIKQRSSCWHVQPPPEFKWQAQILSEENEKNIKQSGGINDLKNVKDIQIENENKALYRL